MRFARISTAIITGILTGVMAFALIGFQPFTSSANAAKPTSKSVAANAMAAENPVVARAVERKIGIKIVKRNGKLILLGNVTPPKGPVTVQKATRCDVKQGTCNFKFYKQVGVKEGRYQVRVYAPRSGSWGWRARVGTTISDIWVTCKPASPGAPCPNP